MNIKIILEHDNIECVITMKDFKFSPEMLKVLEEILPKIASKLKTFTEEKKE